METSAIKGSMPYLKLIEAGSENSIMSIAMRVRSELTGLNGSNELLLFYTHRMDSPVKEKVEFGRHAHGLYDPFLQPYPKTVS